jgi:hypothetical protein
MLPEIAYGSANEHLLCTATSTTTMARCWGLLLRPASGVTSNWNRRELRRMRLATWGMETYVVQEFTHLHLARNSK